jgi:hypothetical protein
MSLRQGDGNKKSADVAFSASSPLVSHFFIDGASPCSLFGACCLVVGFLAVHSYAILCAPSSLATKQEYFPVAGESSTSWGIELALSDLLSIHRFVTVNCSVVSKNIESNRTLPIDVSTTKTMLRNSQVVGTQAVERIQRVIRFSNGLNQSDSFRVTQLPIDGLDSLRLKLSVRLSFPNLAGFAFLWTFANPAVDQYVGVSRLLLGCLVGYMLIVFAVHLQFDSDKFTQVLLLLVGISGVVAANPLRFVYRPPSYAEDILLSLFVALYRMFIILQIDALRRGPLLPNMVVILAAGIFFAIYGAIDATVRCDRQVSWGMRDVLIGCHLGYLGVCSVSLVIAVVVGNVVERARLVFIGFSAVLTCGITLLKDFWLAAEGRGRDWVAPDMGFVAAHVIMAAMALFVMHTDMGAEYKDLAGQGEGEKEPGDIGIEQASDESEEDGFDA